MLGDPTDPKNVFRWETVIVNLPGNPQYDPSKPRVYKVRADGTIASDIVCYVDDNRVTAPTEEEATDEAALRHAPASPHHATAAKPSEGSPQVGGDAKEGRALVTNRLPQAAACTPLALGRPLRKARADPSPAKSEV